MRRWLLNILLSLTIITPILFNPSYTSEPRPITSYSSNIIMGNTLVATGEVPQPQTLGSLVGEEDQFKNLHYRTLIKCLAWEESNWRVYAKGDKNRSYGILQYNRPYQSDSLWYSKCFQEYGFDNVWSVSQQLECADLLLQEDFSYVYRWTGSWKQCLN